MTIGTALVIIAVLYLIDKYKLWKKAGVFVAICVGVLGLTVLGWSLYKWEQARAQERAIESQWKPVPENTEVRHASLDDIAACPPNGYRYVENIGCNNAPKTLPKDFFNNSDVNTKLACYDSETGKLTADPFEKFGGSLTGCGKGQLLVTKNPAKRQAEN